jgi:UDP-2-acetamido-3-amino-2,3-dideoxy-glucuronate N-acetyltransferase
LQYHP